jgi:hypothetical protein
MHWQALLGGCLCYPIVVVGGPHFVWVAVLEDRADADDENGGVFLHDCRLSLLTRQVEVFVKYFFGVDEGQLVGEVGVFIGF